MLLVVLYAAGMGVSRWFDSRVHAQNGSDLKNLMLFVGFGVFALVGALLVARRPGNLVGWILASVGLMVALFPAGDSYAAYVMTTRGRPDFLAIAGAWSQSWYWYLLLALVFVYLPLLFPDGRLLSRRWLPAAVLPGIGTLVIVVLGGLTETLTGQSLHYEIANPIGIEGLRPVEELPVFGPLTILLGIGILGAVASVAVRFRRARGIERQQMKWFVYAVALLPTFFVTDYLPWGLGGALFGLVIIALPTSIGVAVLRYRLYEIDLIINRTLVYAALTASLVLVYLGGVISLQYVLRALTGEESQLAVVASTLVIAAMFNPLRRRIQGFIDRIFYRKKYDAARTLEAFSARLRSETDLDALNRHLVDVVRETMRPSHVSLWLRSVEGEHASWRDENL